MTRSPDVNHDQILTMLWLAGLVINLLTVSISLLLTGTVSPSLTAWSSLSLLGFLWQTKLIRN